MTIHSILLDQMATLKDLKQEARSLGLSNDQVRAFGDLRFRATWESAINKSVSDLERIRRSHQLTDLVLLGGLSPSEATEVSRSPMPQLPCPRCHGARWEVAPSSPFALRSSLFTPCPCCQGTGSSIPQAARDPPVDPA